ncbi:glucan biosynthesis protein G [soil metagenome]
MQIGLRPGLQLHLRLHLRLLLRLLTESPKRLLAPPPGYITNESTDLRMNKQGSNNSARSAAKRWAISTLSVVRSLVVALPLALVIHSQAEAQGQMQSGARAASAPRGKAPARPGPFSFETVAERARVLATSSYQAPVNRLPKEWRELDYDAYRDIRFRPEQAIWRGEKLPFELMFFHLGRGLVEPVRINEVTPKGVQPLEYDSSMFDYGKNKLDTAPLKDSGFAGFRVHYSLNNPAYKDELIVFLGASYFRAVGKGQVYGLSARGLAVDTAEPQGEEFPRFTEFWIEKPRKGATSLTINALLNSPRVTGAYKFVIQPGTETVVNVSARIFTRSAVQKIGIAPLTSMFTFGENQPGTNDYRPEVHDSDGLSVHTGEGEWIWRPLVNPQRLLVTSFGTTDVKGFGLQQRDRNFASYEDLEAKYQKRPSAWIEPMGDWGKGRVELVQIPSPDETNDNIVAYWVFDSATAPGRPLNVAYRMRFQQSSLTMPTNLATVSQTRRGRGFVQVPDGDIKFVVEFQGAALKPFKADMKPELVISNGGNAQFTDRNLYQNEETGDWRMIVRMKRLDSSKPIELRAYLAHENKPVSETWSYIVPPQTERP